MNNTDIIFMWLALLFGVQICRFIPLYLPKTVLHSALLAKLNKMLPLAIMLLLVLTGLHLPNKAENMSLFGAEIAALVLVLLSYHFLKNVLLSVVLGIVGLNGLLALVS